MTLKNTAVFAQVPQTAQAVVSNAIALTGVSSLASDDCASFESVYTRIYREVNIICKKLPYRHYCHWL